MISLDHHYLNTYPNGYIDLKVNMYFCNLIQNPQRSYYLLEHFLQLPRPVKEASRDPITPDDDMVDSEQFVAYGEGERVPRIARYPQRPCIPETLSIVFFPNIISMEEWMS